MRHKTNFTPRFASDDACNELSVFDEPLDKVRTAVNSAEPQTDHRDTKYDESCVYLTWYTKLCTVSCYSNTTTTIMTVNGQGKNVFPVHEIQCEAGHSVIISVITWAIVVRVFVALSAVNQCELFTCNKLTTLLINQKKPQNKPEHARCSSVNRWI